jgi:hypothetical protein
MRARWYDPGSGQFLSVDPLAAETDAAYSYAGDNPIGEDDPGGLLSASDFDPLHWFHTEANDYESGCSYVDSVEWGVFGTAEAAAEVGTGGLAANALLALRTSQALTSAEIGAAREAQVAGLTGGRVSGATIIRPGWDPRTST